MARRKRKSRVGRRPKKVGWWASLDPDARRRAGRMVQVSVAAVALLAGSVFGLQWLDAHVHGRLAERDPGSLVLIDLPQRLVGLADGDIHDALMPMLATEWANEDLCQAVAAGIRRTGWTSKVHYVRRLDDGDLEASCRYRIPVAMVQHGASFYLVDDDGFRLPGDYQYDPAWLLVQGVTAPVPEPGNVWEGKGVAAGLDVIRAVQFEPFVRQITAVLVENVGGRLNPRAAHIVLATDRTKGRIRWGSAPGDELEENQVAEKIAILRGNYIRTGRLDANHQVIDISTFPDRFTVPK